MKIETEEIDDWNPDTTQSTLLDKLVVNFTGIKI